MGHCNVIIYSYHYLLDPKIAERVSKELSKDCIVVFDEAHNIDNVCIESLSIDITEDSLRKATRGANNLEKKIKEMRSSDADKLQNEYAKLVEGLRDADEARDENAFMANPGACPQLFRSALESHLCFAALPDDLLQEAVPGNIRRAEHFVAFLKRFVEYLKVDRTHPSDYTRSKTYSVPDANEGSSGHLRNTSVIPPTSQRLNIYRAQTTPILRRASHISCPDSRTHQHRRLSTSPRSRHICHSRRNLRQRLPTHPRTL